jgi:hypothetical protein
MIALIVIASIVGYFLIGIAVAKAVALIDPNIFHDSWSRFDEPEISVLAVTMTVIFWPVTLGLLTLVLLGIGFYHGPWKLWGNFMRKIVGGLWGTSVSTADMKSQWDKRNHPSKCPTKRGIIIQRSLAVRKPPIAHRNGFIIITPERNDDYQNI